MGAIFVDGGMAEVIRVYRNLLSPFILYVAKFSKVLYKEHKEEFLWAAIASKIKPRFQFSDEARLAKIAENYWVEMFQADVIYNNGQIMCTGYGSNRKQAERNASVLGLQWIKEH